MTRWLQNMSRACVPGVSSALKERHVHVRACDCTELLFEYANDVCMTVTVFGSNECLAPG